MRCGVVILFLLGLTCYAQSSPMHYGQRVREVREALDHVNQVRSALRRSLGLFAEDNQEQKRSGGSALSGAWNFVSRAAELAKRHLDENEIQKRDDDPIVLREVAEKFAKSVDELKHKRQAEGWNMAGGGILGAAVNAVKRHAELARRHVEQEELEKREKDLKREEEEMEKERSLNDFAESFKRAVDDVGEEKKRAFQEAAESLAKRACGIGLFCSPEAVQNMKRAIESAKIFKRAVADKVERKREEQTGEQRRMFRDLGDTMRDTAAKLAEKREEAKNYQLRSAADSVKRALDSITNQKKRGFGVVAQALKKRYCGIGLGCSPEEAQEFRRAMEAGKVMVKKDDM